MFAQLATGYAAKSRGRPGPREEGHGPRLGEEPRQRRLEPQGPPAQGRLPWSRSSTRP
ncbi:MAG: hypothetical protein MZU91_11845 [Desulfosudis oleivorans]|nr:hypothetical protein [Desulfosudis oleivorans]